MRLLMTLRAFNAQILKAREVDRRYCWIKMEDWFLRHSTIGDHAVEFDDSLDTPDGLCYEPANGNHPQPTD